MHPGRSARNHLLFLAQSQGLPAKRVDEVLDLVGLRAVAGKRAGTFSLGMSQRLGIAAAMLGDPRFLLLDEPVNGLDPEGVLWIRNLMKFLASEGRTIFVSSHLMNEMAVTADHLIVIGRGRLIADSATADVIARSSEQSVRVRTPDAARLTSLIEAEGGKVSPVPPAAEPGAAADTAPALTVTGLAAARIGELAASSSVVLHELSPQLASLEEAFMELTAGSLEFGEHGPAAVARPPPTRPPRASPPRPPRPAGAPGDRPGPGQPGRRQPGGQHADAGTDAVGRGGRLRPPAGLGVDQGPLGALDGLDADRVRGGHHRLHGAVHGADLGQLGQWPQPPVP